ncbi:MAG: PilZ domain-containing protein [Candidatus Aminicenantes bacterium]|nr:PilZ domain-containing protein [Candidatus Aminicenantes bacterium]
MDESKIERRACVRFKIPGGTVSYQKKTLFFAKSGFIEEFCPILDISRGGVRFLSQNPLKPNTEVLLKISVPGERIPFTMKGAVKWTSPAEGKTYKHQVGVQFHPYGETKDQNLPGNLVKIIALEQKFLDRDTEGEEPPDSNKDEFQI